jgi:nucleotide-binding universal stress UspA family protein
MSNPPPAPIVVGVDFTPSSRAALAEALRIAALDGAPVRVVHVIDSLVILDMQEAIPGTPPDLADRLVADVRDEWRRFAAGIPGADAAEFDAVVDGRVHALLKRVRDTGASLLVLGAYGERQANVGVGTLASACVRKSTADVLLVRDTHAGPFRRVVVGIDFSPTSLRAAEQAARFAARDRADLVALHLFTPPWRRLHYRAPTPEAAPHFQQQYRDALLRRLRAFVEPVAVPGAPAPSCELVEAQDRRASLVDQARRLDADLLVVGTRGRTNLRYLLLGSTAERALLESTSSVLAVKPADFRLPIAIDEEPGTAAQVLAGF